MIRYETFFVNVSGVFPDAVSVNASGPSATDGTEFVKGMIDDEWGARQAIMDHAKLTPDTVSEAPGTSQFVEAIQKGMAVGPGIGVVYWKNDDPATLGDRVLLLVGQGVLRTSFPELDDAVYVGDSDNPTASAFYHANDAPGASRNPAGIYLILPDMRGYVLRGLDVAAVVDPDGASRDLGHIQNDAFQGHHHSNINNANQSTSQGVQGGAGTAPTVNSASISVTDPATDGVNGSVRTGPESRMINVATNYGITYY